ncbi:MAG: protein kinase domain-containing protein [Gemmatimonadaceae bacterium]
MPSDVARLSAAFAGRYQVEREIGAGGMATVYVARDVKHDRDVALKVLRPEVALAFGAERFAREIGIAGRLTHPNILPMFDSGTIRLDGGTVPFYVMPYIEGESLRVRLGRERQLTLADTRRIVRDIGEALAFAHAHGIVHRDVKPENILLVGERALLADFGIARAAATGTVASDRLTATGIAIGTPVYMSPEQAAADPAVDARSDSYALAVMAYEMLAGEPPFTGATPQAILARQITGDVHPLTTIRPHVVTRSMDAAIRRALSPAPADRFPRVLDFVSAFESAEAAQSVSARALGGGRSRIAALGGVLAALAIATVLAIRGGGVPNDERLGLGVMPFRALAGATEWSETLPDLLSTFLDGTPGVRVADPWALWRSLRPTGNERARSPDPNEADRLARRAGVRRYVMGAILRSGERLDLTLRIYGVGVAEPVASFTMNGSVDSTAQLAQRTAVQVLERIWEGTNGGPSVPRMESVMTQSPDALKSYLAAREAMRRGLPDSANAAITRAISIDSTFALGLLEAVMIRSWVQSARGQQYSGLRELAERAMASRDSLSERQRLRLEATLASLETDGRRAASAWQQLLERDSTDLGATNGLSYVSLVYGWQYGATLTDMLRAAERAVQIDSTDGPALFRRAHLSLGTGDLSDVRRQLARLKALNTDAPLIRAIVRSIEALLANDQEFAAMVDSLAVTPVIEWTGIYRNLRAYRPDRAIVLCERSLRLTPPGPFQDFAVNALVSVLGAAGNLQAIDSIWSAGAFASLGGPPVRLAQRILHAALLGIEDSALTTRALKTLSDYVPIDSALAYFNPRPVWSVSYTLGAWHAQRGDTAVARKWLAIISEFQPGGSPRTWRESIKADIASRLAQRAGNADSARALAALAFNLWTIHTENTTDADLEPAMRFRYAQLLLDGGARDSAARILRSFIPPTSWVGSYVSPAHMALGGMAEQARDAAAAAQHYDRAVQLLSLGGPPVSAQLAEAEAALRRTVREPVRRYGQK